LAYDEEGVINMAINFTHEKLSGLRIALSKGPNRVGVFLHLRTETDPVSETL
jgi:hypothetical protein